VVEELAEQLTAYVAEGRIGDAEPRQLSQGTYGSFAHGDLLATNVLVYDGRHPEPTVIDASRFGRAHWATDPARLAVDVLMHSVDPGAQSMFFTGFERWRDAAIRLGDLEPLLDPAPDAVTTIPDPDGATGDGGTAALAALNWLTGNLRAFCPGLSGDEEYRAHAWEWHIALARYLLRSSYNQEITVPKRALAIVAAHDQLTAAARAVPD
jgi:hypothetical protein